jgi:hypothetical protein
VYEMNELDTCDWLTDYYKHFRSPDQIRATLESLGLEVKSCGLGGNGVEARACSSNTKACGRTVVRDASCARVV